MNGPVSLLIALVSYGNAYLAEGNKAPKLDFNNSTLIYNNALIFSESGNANKLLAKSAEDWFVFLKSTGCKRLKICYSHSKQLQGNDFENAGFVGGGGNWYLEADYGNHANYWVQSESTVDNNSPNRRIWATSFIVVKDAPMALSQELSIDVAKRNLHIALTNISEFAASQKLNYWKKYLIKQTIT